MKICIIVDDYMPTSIKKAAKMMHELACEFKYQGHEVSVITPNTNTSEKLIIDNLDGIDIYRFKSGKIKNVNKIQRAINETLLSFNAWNNCKDFIINNPHDIIIYHSPSIFFGSLVKKLKKQWNAKSYLILRDLFPQWAIDNNLLKKNSIITKYFQYFEKINYDNADRIGVMSDNNLKWFNKYYKNNKKAEVLYNWASPIKYNGIENKYKKKLGIENKIVYFYGGNLGYAQDMMNIIRLAINMKDITNVHFVLVGAGDEFNLTKDAINKESLVNITLLPAVNQTEFKQMLYEFDVGLFTLNKNHNTHNFPGKILGYLVEELPILGSINKGNDLKDILEQYNAGLISINPDDKLFYKNALLLLEKEKRKIISINGYNLLVNKFSVQNSVKQIMLVLK
jgi:glycosyltransferase involved in cell wall biosynthesis